MPLEKLKTARKKVIGAKQTSKAVEKDQVSQIFIAQDADPQVIRNLEQLSREKGMEITYIETMAALGKACGIDVGSAAAGIVKN